MTSILVLDESLPRLETLSKMLEEQGYDLVLTVEPTRAIRLCQEVCFDAVLCNLYLTDNELSSQTGKKAESGSLCAGIDAISKLTSMEPHQKVIVISPDLPLAQLGAFGVINKQSDDLHSIAQGVMELIPHTKITSAAYEIG